MRGSEDALYDFYMRAKRMNYTKFAEELWKYLNLYYEDGFMAGKKEGFEFGINYGATWMEDDLFRLLRSEGIGAERANRIIDKMLEVQNE